MRLSSLADYAVVMMTAAARRHGAPDRVNATLMAEEVGVPLPTVQKLVSKLSAARLIESTRGSGGGFRLARAPEHISVADIVEAIEGPIALTACVDGARHDCAVEGACRVKPHWGVVNQAVRGALGSVSLARLTEPLPLAEAVPALQEAAELAAAAPIDIPSFPSPSPMREGKQVIA